MPASDELSDQAEDRAVPKRKRWLRRIVLGLLGLAVGVYVVLLLTFQISKHQVLSRLESGSALFESELGPIEYATQGEGPVVLFMHGTPGGYDSGLQEPEKETGLQLLSPSRPGYLRTPLAVGQSPAQQADAFVLLLDGLGIERVGVVGLSGGGPVAVELAKRHPERVNCLVLFSALVEADKPEDAADVSAVPVVDRFFGSGFAQWITFSFVELFPKLALESPILTEEERSKLAQDPAKLQKFLAGMWREFPSSVRREGYENESQQFTTLDLGAVEELQVPTLVIHGTEDPVCSIEDAESFVARVPGAESLWIEGGGHLIVISHAEEIEPVILEFLLQHAEQ